jgi:hypothetical protein
MMVHSLNEKLRRNTKLTTHRSIMAYDLSQKRGEWIIFFSVELRNYRILKLNIKFIY